MLVLACGVAAYAVHLLWFSTHVPPFLQARIASHAPSLYLHFLGGSAALVLGALQMSTLLRQRWPRLHRWMGRLYLTAVLLAGLAGLQMASVAVGGLVAQTGFATMAVLWLGSALMGYRAIRRGDVRAHRNWMMRNYALTLAALTLRLYLGITLAGLQMDFMQVYPFISWACWIPNLLLAEWLFVRPAGALPADRPARAASA